jgi:TIR domain-containing protein/iSTAND domain-containing protein
MSFLFLSHANPDKPKIRHIVDALIDAGLKVWLDNPASMGYTPKQINDHFYHLEAGGRYRDKIDSALRTASAVLVCWSEKAKENRDVWHAEASVARALLKLVACRIDDVDPQTLPDGHGEEQIPDLRPDLPSAATSGEVGAHRIKRSKLELDTQLALLVAAIKARMVETATHRFEKRIEQRAQRDPFAPYLIDRADQEGAVGTAIEEVANLGGMRAFLIVGPENECPDEFLERLKRHTSPQRLNGRCWVQLYVEWPFERATVDFGDEYRRRLAVQLGLPSTAPTSAVAKALSQRDRPVAVLSLMHAQEWKVTETSRIKACVAWWQELAADAIRFSAVPILCVKMPEAKPGWKGCPGGAAPGATVSNSEIWREVLGLHQPRSGIRLLPFLGPREPPTAITTPPVLHPVRKADADRWMSERFEIMSQERSAAKTAIDGLFGGAAVVRHGTALKDFVAALEPLFREKA